MNARILAALLLRFILSLHHNMICDNVVTQLANGNYRHECRNCHRFRITNKLIFVRECEAKSFTVVNSLDCVYRSAYSVRSIGCDICGRRGELEPVYKCELFGECTIRKTSSKKGLPNCLGCMSRSEVKNNSTNVKDASFFDRVVVISLARRQDRLERFRKGLPNAWPFKQPELFTAIDGQDCVIPDWFHVGRGAYGCYLSHCKILQQLVDSTQNNIFILEDDATFSQNFAIDCLKCIEELPPDWDMLYLGGQHFHRRLGKPEKYSEHLSIPFNVNRTHAYAVTRQMAEYLLAYLQDKQWNKREHIDHKLGRMVEKRERKIFCARPWLVGQIGGKSNISGKTHNTRFWNG